MGVDLCTYRHRIGLFQYSSTKTTKVKIKLKKCPHQKFNLFANILLLHIAASSLLLDKSVPVSSSSPPITDGPRNHIFDTMSQHSTGTAPKSPEARISWPFGISGSRSSGVNKTVKMKNGNRRAIGYNIAAWNCGRGLISKKNTDTDKLVDIKLFIQEHKPHLLGIIEADIHGPNSTSNRTPRYTTEEINERLKIEGYSIILPQTWHTHNQARLIVYISDEIKGKIRANTQANNDLPSITIEIGLGREKKTLCNFYYREWTGGISRDDSYISQYDRLNRQVQIWRDLSVEERDLVILGDSNLCSLSWNDPEYPSALRNLANLMTDYHLEETMTQLIETYTRTEVNGDHLQKSCIDHITTNVPGKCLNASVLPAGGSDHLAVMVKKMH